MCVSSACAIIWNKRHPLLPIDVAVRDADPTNKVRVDMSHVTLAIGRHCGDVMPLRVVIQGGGEHTLTVAVTRRADHSRIHRLPPRTDP